MDSVDSTRKEKKSAGEDTVSQRSGSSENASDKLVCSTTGIEKMELAQDEGKQKSLEMNLSEVASVGNSECTGVSEVSLTTDPNDSLGEICEDLSETGKSVKDVLGEESQRFAGESDSYKQIKSQGNHHSVSSDKQLEAHCESKIGLNLSEETVSPSLKVEKQGAEIEIMQSGESETPNSKQEIVTIKAGKKDKSIRLQSEASNSLSSKEGIASVKSENQGKDIKVQSEASNSLSSKEGIASAVKSENQGKNIKVQSEKSKTSTSKAIVSMKTEKRGKDIRLQRDDSRTSNAREKVISSKVERQDKESNIQSDESTNSNSKEEIARLNKCKQDVKETSGEKTKERTMLSGEHFIR